jgi:hypothetical protein
MTKKKGKKMSSKEKEEDKSKVRLTLRQIGDPTFDDELEYEVIDTSCARFACKEILCREDAIKICDENNVRIVFKAEDNKISGFRD